jgi:CRP-like cAMP-binding protein
MCGTGEEKVKRAQCTDFQLWFWLNFAVDVWFIIDIILNFRTGFVFEGLFVNDAWKVAKHYMLRGTFFIDVLGSFPLNLVLMSVNPSNPYGDIEEDSGGDATRMNRMLRLLRMSKLAKLARMFKLFKYLEGAEAIIDPGSLQLFKLIFISLFSCHLFGCAWWLISDLELSGDLGLENDWYTEENQWQPANWLRQEPKLHIKYLHAFYWGAAMVTSMVPSDVMPITSIEVTLTVTAMFYGLMMNAYVISSLTAALGAMNSKKEIVGAQIQRIKSLLLIKHVPADIRSRILEYYEYQYTSSAGLAQMTVLNNMPPALKATLDLASNRRLITRCPIFRQMTSASLLMLLDKMTPAVFVPNQVIVVEGTPLLAIYFIIKGIVMLSRDSGPCEKLTEPENWGADDYLRACLEEAEGGSTVMNRKTARAGTYCDVIALSTELMTAELATDSAFQEYVQSEIEKAESQLKIITRLRETTLRRAPTSLLGAKLAKLAAGSSSSVEESAGNASATMSPPAEEPSRPNRGSPDGSPVGARHTFGLHLVAGLMRKNGRTPSVATSRVSEQVSTEGGAGVSDSNEPGCRGVGGGKGVGFNPISAGAAPDQRAQPAERKEAQTASGDELSTSSSELNA